jgi:hypothetical protein
LPYRVVQILRLRKQTTKGLRKIFSAKDSFFL